MTALSVPLIFSVPFLWVIPMATVLAVAHSTPGTSHHQKEEETNNHEPENIAHFVHLLLHSALPPLQKWHKGRGDSHILSIFFTKLSHHLTLLSPGQSIVDHHQNGPHSDG